MLSPADGLECSPRQWSQITVTRVAARGRKSDQASDCSFAQTKTLYWMSISAKGNCTTTMQDHRFLMHLTLVLLSHEHTKSDQHSLIVICFVMGESDEDQRFKRSISDVVVVKVRHVCVDLSWHDKRFMMLPGCLRLGSPQPSNMSGNVHSLPYAPQHEECFIWEVTSVKSYQL